MAKRPKLIILYDDPDFVIINKAPDMLSIPDRFVKDHPNILKALQPLYENVFVVHRLDRATSGIICFAKTEVAHKHLNKQFQERTVDKYYLAIVDGIPSPKNGEIDLAIAESQTTPGKMLIKTNGKPSLTIYKTVESFKHYSLMSANIKTGRTHQVRVHFNAIGHPLAVDPLYGRRKKIFLSKIKGKKYNQRKGTEEQPMISRCTLHAHSLSFDHPSTGERVTFEAEPPKDFRAFLNQLGKWGR